MRNLRAVAATLKPLFENPELGAMAEICEILQDLPDDAARLRVMRWSFARFGGEEFKRTVPVLPPQTDVARQAAANHYEAVAAEEIPAIEDVHGTSDVEDIADQVSELNDLVPRRPVAVSRLRQV